MASKLPLPLENFILNGVKDNVSKLDKVAQYYRGALVANSTDAAIAAMLVDFDIDATPFAAALGKKVTDFGIRMSSVLNTKQLFEKLSKTDIVNWQDAIVPIYGSKTIPFKALFPKGREPFQSGKQADRLLAISGLLGAIGSDPLLVTIKATIQANLNLLNTSIGTKVSNVGVVKSDSSSINLLIETLAAKMFKIFHELSIKFATTPKLIMDYVPFDLIKREKISKHITGVISKHKFKKIWKRKWADTQQIELINHGTVPLYFYRTASAKQAFTGGGQTVAAGQTLQVPFSALGATGLEFLMIYNSDPLTKGSYEVTLV